MFGVLLIGYICNIIAMHFYPLNKEMMDSISEDIARIKRESQSVKATDSSITKEIKKEA